MSNLSTTADDILNCAQTLVIAGGYNGFSYADIAAVVGIRKASIHHHFPTKADLVRTLVSRYREEARAGFAALDGMTKDPREQLRQYIGYWDRCIADASASFCVCALLASELPALPAEVAGEVRRHFETLSHWLTGIFQRGKAAGTLRLAKSPRDEAEAFMAMVHGGMLSARVHGNPKLFGTIGSAALDRLLV